MGKKLFGLVTKLLAFFFFGLAIWLVFKEVHSFGSDVIINQIIKLHHHQLFLSLFFILLDYIALSGYDFLAISYIGAKIKEWIIVKTAMISFALTNTTGHAYLAGGSVRYAFYSKEGLSQIQVLKIIIFESLTYLIGLGIILDVCLIAAYFLQFKTFSYYEKWLEFGAVIGTILIIVYFVLPQKQFGKYIVLPSFKQKICQVVVGVSDCITASLVFYTLFLGHLEANYFYVASLFFIAQIVGIVSQVPGGLGVFEATFLYLYPHTEKEKLPLIAVLISFRVLYYFVPLLVSLIELIFDWLKYKIKKSLDSVNI